ncbi:MAG TPA: hypothetical protein VIX59_03560 [Candidatus Binataceae bacterium]
MAALLAIALGAFPGASAWSYPGGPLDDVTDAAPYCAGCHSSIDLKQLRSLPPMRAAKMTAASHLDAIKAGTGNYAKLTVQQRAQLANDVQKVDDNAKISLEAPQTVHPGQDFTVDVTAHGGSGPVVGVVLLDIDVRNQARSIQSEGFQISSAPTVTGPDGNRQTDWLNRRYDDLAHNLSFIVVFGVKADLAANRFSTSRVTYNLAAPDTPGKYTICAGFLYGTEKASPLGRVEAQGRTMPLGGFSGASGRISFSEVKIIQVQTVQESQ